jgi:hypothetical protein
MAQVYENIRILFPEQEPEYLRRCCTTGSSNGNHFQMRILAFASETLKDSE